MLLKQNRLHWLSQNYHSEDAAICYFQTASQQRGMKRAESQREQRLSFIQWKQEPLTEERVLFATVFQVQIKLSPCTSSSLISVSCLPFDRFNASSEKGARDICFSLSIHLNIILIEYWVYLQEKGPITIFPQIAFFSLINSIQLTLKQDQDRLHMFTFGTQFKMEPVNACQFLL